MFDLGKEQEEGFHMYSTNRRDGEPATILVFEGFSGPDEINFFVDLLLKHGIILRSREDQLH